MQGLNKKKVLNMDKQNLETVTMGRGSSMPCSK